jgi:RNA polymerase sigma-70 factor (ECF subfamily)
VKPGGEERIAEDLRRRLTQAVNRACPRWLSSHAEDIVHTALLRVLGASAKKGEGDPDLSSLYIEKAAYSAVVDEIRKLRRRREDPAPDEQLTATPGPEHANPETMAVSREIAEGIHHCLSRLPDLRRLAVTLSLQGHSVPEVASIMRWRAKKAENLVYRGMDDLRRCLTSRGLTR